MVPVADWPSDTASAAAWTEQGKALKQQRRSAHAIACFEVAIALDPLFVYAFFQRGMTLVQLDCPELAALDFATAWQRHCGYHAARAALGVAQLYLGDYQHGWANFDWRWLDEGFLFEQRKFAKPRWNGKRPIAGKTILLWGDQGYGDQLQFVRYVPAVVALGAKVRLQVADNLVRLMDQSLRHLGVETVPMHASKQAEVAEPDWHYDYHYQLSSLPLVCGTDTLEKIPNQPYLRADPHEAQVWLAQLDELWLAQQTAMSGAAPLVHDIPRPIRIGLAWGSGTNSHAGADRTAGLAHFSRLLGAFDPTLVQWISLQIGDWHEELVQAQAQGAPFTQHLVDPNSQRQDWASSAALIAQLDLVITCDTGIAHLAGAMGKPTWIVLRHYGCWRWLRPSSHPVDSPWYPSVRLFRQRQLDDWTSVMDDVIAALQSSRLYADALARKARGICQWDDPAQACALLEAALSLDPDDPKKRFDYGALCFRLLRFEQARQCFTQLLQQNPSMLDVHYALSQVELHLGDYAHAWAHYEHRWGSPSFIKETRTFTRPLWLGNESLVGKTIVLWGDLGYGDQLQMCRYAPCVAALGAKVILQVPQSMARLLQQSMASADIEVLPYPQDAAHWFEAPEPSIPYDYHCPLQSLPLACRTESLAQIPAAPYLKADAAQQQRWAKQLDEAWQQAGPQAPSTKPCGSVWFGQARALSRPPTRAISAVLVGTSARASSAVLRPSKCSG